MMVKYPDRILSLIVALMILLSMMNCDDPDMQELLLADFESPGIPNGLVWECGRWFSLSDSHATQGYRALKAELISSKQPIFRIFPAVEDWRPFRRFSGDVFNADFAVVSLVIHFIDKDSDADPGKFYSRIWELSPGANQITIPIFEIRTGPEKRNLKIYRMAKIAFGLSETGDTCTLFFDNILLSQ
jgi:hypothetical protein